MSQPPIKIEEVFELSTAAGLHRVDMESRNPPIRSTPLMVLDECPRKFLYGSRFGISPKVTERPLTLGSFLHLTLSALFQGSTEQEALAASETSLREETERCLQMADRGGFLPDGQDVKSALKNLEEDYHKSQAMAIVFWRAKAFDRSKWDLLRDPDGAPMVERIIEVKVKGLAQPIRVTCDLALVNKETGGVWIVDFKSTSFDPIKRAQPTRFSPQLALYRIGLQLTLDHWYGGHTPKVVGSVHAIIQKPGIKYCPSTKDKGGFSDYITRLVQWYQDKEHEAPDHPPMILDFNTFSGPLLTDELWIRLEKYCAAATCDPDPDIFYRAGESACLKYNRVCPYMLLCTADPVMWPGLIRDHYTIKFREDEENPDES